MVVHNEKEIVKNALAKLACGHKTELASCIRECVNKDADNSELARNFYFMDITLDDYINSLCSLVVEGKF